MPYDDDFEECEECLGTGEICVECFCSVIICSCDDPEIVECPDCGGTGVE